ncbi:hypothetical protein [Vibrio cionasavignyae]|uniref:hypothetical protein n=1 Tax=Vibrio cionasavignyae TaxID=2910252 RepID=UPI003D0D9743
MVYFPAIIAALVIALYSAFAFRKLPASEHQAWIHTIIASLTSIAIGVTVAISIFSYQENLKNEQRKEQLDLMLQTELSRMLGHLTDNEAKASITYGEDEKLEYQVMFFSPTSLKIAAESGLYDLQSTNQMLELVTSVEALQIKNEAFLKAMSSNLPQHRHKSHLEWHIHNLNRARGGIERGVRWLAKYENIELLKTIKYH